MAMERERSNERENIVQERICFRSAGLEASFRPSLFFSFFLRKICRYSRISFPWLNELVNDNEGKLLFFLVGSSWFFQCAGFRSGNRRNWKLKRIRDWSKEKNVMRKRFPWFFFAVDCWSVALHEIFYFALCGRKRFSQF